MPWRDTKYSPMIEPIQLIPTFILSVDTNTGSDDGIIRLVKIFHLFAGDIIPAGVLLADGGSIIYPSYKEDSSIAFKIVHKQSIPYMSAFEVGTSFFNPRSLTENHYLTWGYSKPDYLANYPFITITKA